MNASAKRRLSAIFRAGLAAADPEHAVCRRLVREGDRLRVGARDCAPACEIDLSRVKQVWIVGAGKASAFMGRAVQRIIGDRVTGGWINVKTGHGCDLPNIRVHEAAHPIPDRAGVAGSREIARLLRHAARDDLVVCCISGGGSALLPLPVEEVSLEEKRQTTAALLACGAPIQQVNAVRKHLSQIKGGQLARMARPARVISLILSDVIGDPLDTIASGPTAPDATTFHHALAIIRQHRLEGAVPRAALDYLRAGAAGARPETPKPADPLFDRVANVVVANNRAAVAACAAQADSLGYRPCVLTTALQGEAREVAAAQAAAARGVAETGHPVPAPACLISGGETTVTVRGLGLGGRNQEYALAAAMALSGADRVALLAAGTDGTDGPTDAAGAFADGATLRRAERLGLSADDALKNNDAYHFFHALGDLLKTGPTGTNVMDLYLFLVDAP